MNTFIFSAGLSIPLIKATWGATSPAAAGHRARRASDSSPQKELLGLFIARDLNKDQSYFLWTLTQKQLKHCLFPIGDYLKSEVRTIAREAGLPTAEKKDSQGICFLGKITLQDFLKQYIPEEQGEVFTVSGQKVGEHSGVHFYTIGQRHGLGISGASPYYIAEKDVRTNTLVVAEGDENPSLYRQEVELRDLNFVRSFTSLIRANSGVRVMARVRYRQPLSRAELSFESAGAGKLIFEKPQKFVAPGQSVVFYLPAEVATKAGSGSGSASAQAAADMEMLGGGVIQ